MAASKPLQFRLIFFMSIGLCQLDANGNYDG
ncbi:uncharacterized protein FPRO_00773 [Fusarium proliferatum ET1]|uniref:Uncharacterized protein n=1 Tax=Fusarium proliferatum (strain ET1) TaxID=1227346 RepID=A0A1L7V734_FUSPR|nr:uncharacterized protein FPRO_00773 [Fusarium proliferatum ET1]CVL10358.1 uncharacterized protein FPRN_00737 [Fusarium proliferatum]CZR35105.1 uncharacterized protein FPRO_00773 [Fusarium proliferatum ET1]